MKWSWPEKYKMKMKIYYSMLLVFSNCLPAPLLWAQATDTVDHSSHQMPAAAPVPAAIDHAAMGHEMSIPSAPANGDMDHDNMSMTGGTAPAGARSPHEYSDGFVIGQGQYALPGGRHLHLADEHKFSSFTVNELEWNKAEDQSSTAYDLQAWMGKTYNRITLKAEGEVEDKRLSESRTELLFTKPIAPFWDGQLGVRYDADEDHDRGWVAFGVQGLAPYWFEVSATGYVGNSGRTAVRLEADYELLLTQKLIVQPKIELVGYGSEDLGSGVGSGLSDTTLGVRLRYEITRQLAPYIGLERTKMYGQTAKLNRSLNVDTEATRWVAGLRFWF